MALLYVVAALVGLFAFTESGVIEMSQADGQNTVCPGGEHRCPGTYTCCRVSSGWGCCKFTHGTCCKDMIHCCPSGFSCSTTGSKCLRGTETQASAIKVFATPIKAKMTEVQLQPEQEKPDDIPVFQSDVAEVDKGSNIVCPGGHYRCRTGQTCCRHEGGGWACCPLPMATCCSDMRHCCPHGTRCSPSKHCLRDDGSKLPWSVKTEAEPVDQTLMRSIDSPAHDIVCPGGHYRCPYGNTCCPHAHGGYGCCPRPHATCCSDLLHCCPHGYHCSRGGRCKRDDHSIPWMTKTIARASSEMSEFKRYRSFAFSRSFNMRLLK